MLLSYAFLYVAKFRYLFTSVTEAKYMISVLFIFLKMFQYSSCRSVVLTVSLHVFGGILDERQICNEFSTL